MIDRMDPRIYNLDKLDYLDIRNLKYNRLLHIPYMGRPYDQINIHKRDVHLRFYTQHFVRKCHLLSKGQQDNPTYKIL